MAVSNATIDHEAVEQYRDRIADFFEGKTVFITGGTGFLGKVLVEKLLRCCSGVGKIYLLVRAKKGKEPQMRLNEMFKDRLFDCLKTKAIPEIFSKVEAISGDVESLDLGLSKSDREKLIREVEIIYNCAATIRFDEALRRAVMVNVRGTRETLTLAKECKKLAMFCHVSTAYCHLNEKILYEKAYPPPADPHNVIATCEWLNDAEITKMTKTILGDYPNTYAFTKALGESLVTDEMDNLPIIMTRPTVVIPVYQDPLVGWTDNLNGPGGLLIAAGKGVLRTMLVASDKYADYIPVDIVVNGLLYSALYFTTTKNPKRIFNMSTSGLVKVSFSELIDMGRKIATEIYPFKYILWYPGGSMKSSKILHYISLVLFQWIPAVIADAFLTLLRYEPLLIRVQKRIWKGYEVFEYYVNRQWEFRNEESLKLCEGLNPIEKKIYKLDFDDINYFNYFTQCTYQARHLVQETDEMLPTARRNIKIVWFLDRLFKTLIVFGFLYLLWKYLF